VAKKGDSIGSIAKKFQVDSGAILKANLLASADQLQVGEELVVPGGAPPAPVIKVPSNVGNVKNVFRPPSEAPPSREVEAPSSPGPPTSTSSTNTFTPATPASTSTATFITRFTPRLTASSPRPAGTRMATAT